MEVAVGVTEGVSFDCCDGGGEESLLELRLSRVTVGDRMSGGEKGTVVYGGKEEDGTESFGTEEGVFVS